MGFEITKFDLNNLDKVLNDRPELSLTKIAKAIGIDRSTISRIKSGQTKMMSDLSYQKLKLFLQTYLKGTQEEINELQNLMLYDNKRPDDLISKIKASLIKANDLKNLELYTTMQKNIDLQQELRVEMQKSNKRKRQRNQSIKIKVEKSFKSNRRNLTDTQRYFCAVLIIRDI